MRLTTTIILTKGKTAIVVVVALLITHLPQTTILVLVGHQLNHLAIRLTSNLTTIATTLISSHLVGVTTTLAVALDGETATVILDGATQVTQDGETIAIIKVLQTSKVTHSKQVAITILVVDQGSQTHSCQVVLVTVTTVVVVDLTTITVEAAVAIKVQVAHLTIAMRTVSL